MTSPLRIRTPKETILASIELLPEADLWRPIIERANDSGYLSCRAAGSGVLAQFGLNASKFIAWAKQQQRLPAAFPRPEFALMDVAILHEFWVEQQPIDS